MGPRFRGQSRSSICSAKCATAGNFDKRISTLREFSKSAVVHCADFLGEITYIVVERSSTLRGFSISAFGSCANFHSPQ